MSLNRKAQEFAEAVVKTKEFIALKQAKAAINKNTELRSKIENFKNRQAKLYSSNLTQNQIKSKMTELDNEFKALSRIPQMSNFLKAEKAFNDMMLKVNESINSTIDAHLNSM